MNNIIKELNFDEAVGYHYDCFPPTELNYRELAKPIGSATAALARYDGLLRTLHNSEVLLAPLRRQEAVISSRLEGTITTLDELLKFEAEQDLQADLGQTLHRSDVLEVLSYTRAMHEAQRMLEEGIPISGRVVRAAHRTLLTFTRGANKQPGEFKTEQNYVIDQINRKVLFIPIDPGHFNEGFAKLENFIHDNELEPLLQTALAHVEFEALHPFKDGNGRVGRMLITLMLWQRGLIQAPHFYISGYLEDRTDEYLHRLREVSNSGQWTEWCMFFLRAIEAQAEENLHTAEKIRDLYEEMKILFTRVLSSRWSITALDYVFSRPVFRNSHFTARSGIPRPTASRFTPILLDRGIIRTVEYASGSRSAIYAFEPLLSLVRR